MCSPEMLVGETGEKIVERFAEAAGVTYGVIGNDESRGHGSTRIVYADLTGSDKQDKKPRQRPDQARGRSNRKRPWRRLASSLKHWTVAQSAICASAAWRLLPIVMLRIPNRERIERY